MFYLDQKYKFSTFEKSRKGSLQISHVKNKRSISKPLTKRKMSKPSGKRVTDKKKSGKVRRLLKFPVFAFTFRVLYIVLVSNDIVVFFEKKAATPKVEKVWKKHLIYLLF